MLSCIKYNYLSNNFCLSRYTNKFKIESFSKILKFPFLFLVCLTRVRAENCNQEELTQCARPLHIISSTSDLSVVTRKEELDSLCP